MHARPRFVGASALVALLLDAGAAQAQNLLLNGDFSVPLVGWMFPVDVGATWSSSGVDNLSGSTFVRNLSGVPGSYAGGIQCVEADAGALYELRGSAQIPFAYVGTSGVLIDVLWADTPSCELPALRIDDVLATEVAGTWTSGALSVTSPPGTTHVAMRIRAHQLGTPPFPPGAYFDALYVPEPTSPQFAAVGALALLGWLRGRERFHGEPD